MLPKRHHMDRGDASKQRFSRDGESMGQANGVMLGDSVRSDLHK